MEMNYSASSVAQGRINQAKAKEQPNTFSSENGVTSVTQMGSLDKPKQRMAGQFGHRALEYMNDPAEFEQIPCLLHGEFSLHSSISTQILFCIL